MSVAFLCFRRVPHYVGIECSLFFIRAVFLFFGLALLAILGIWCIVCAVTENCSCSLNLKSQEVLQ